MSNNVKEINNFDGWSPRVMSVGHGNFVVASKIVAILESGSLPVRRLREAALKSNLLVDATAGRKTRSIIVTSSRHVVLSALAPQTLHDRVNNEVGTVAAAQFEVEDGEFVS